MDQGTKICPNCGTKMAINAEICPKCGAMQAQPMGGYATGPAQIQPQVQSRKKTGMFLLWGWLSAVVSLFIPIVGIASIVLGSLTIKNKRVAAGVVLIVAAVVFIFWGMTGFAQGFFGAM